MHAIRQHLALWAFMALSAIPFAATAVTINVTDQTDPNVLADGTGGCTLRKALSNAVANGQPYLDCPTGSGGADIITFSSSAAIPIGTIGALPFINKDITVTGPKTITGNGSAEIFHIASSGTLTLTGFTLSGAGNSAIRMDGTAHLSVNGSAFNNNTTGACCGGAIGGDGTIALVDVTFTSNTAPNGSGGAIHLNGADASTISGVSAFTNNSALIDGGAIYVSLTGSLVSPANFTINSAVFTGNKASASGGATHGGGAIYSSASGVAFMSLFDVTFIGNIVDGNDGRGGAIHNAKSDAYPMIVDHGKFLGNMLTSNNLAIGAGIFTADNIVVRASSFLLNDAGAGMGGAIASNAPPPDPIPTPPEPGAVIANSTIQGNTAASGGGIYNYGQFGNKELKLINVTLDGNTGGGIFTENIGGGTAITRLANTIVSNNSGANCTNNVPANVVNNIVGNLQFPGATCPADSVITTGDPKLNGPSINPPDILTVTMSLQAGSAASNTGDNATCAAFPILTFDQRSFVVPVRIPPLSGGPNCDIGAYESSIAPGYGSVPGPASTITINTFVGVPQTFNLVISETGDDNLKINSYGFAGSPEITLSNLPAAPFFINDGAGSQTLIITCSSPSAATYSGTVTVTHNATGSPATYTVNCNVVLPLAITTASPLASHTVLVPGYSQTLAATGGTPPYVNWVVTTAPATFPPGLTLTPGTGAITGMPTLAGVYNFTVQVSDSAAAPLSTTKAFQITINAAPVPPTITTATPLPGGTTGTPYPLLTFTNSGGTPGFTWVVTNPLQLPPGISLAANGNLTGTPTLAGVYSFTVQVTDSLALSDSKVFSLTVIDPLVITTVSPLAPYTINFPGYSQTLSATGGTAPYNNWIVSVGALPNGLNLAAGTGIITGTPTVAGTFNFTVQVSDSGALTTTKPFSITINPALSITTATPLPGGTVSVAYPLLTFAAAGGTPPYNNWIVSAGTPVPGLSLAAGTGALTGTPTTPGTYNFTVQVTDSVGATTTKNFSLTVTASLVITTATPLPTGTANIVYPLLTFAAAGGTPAYNNWIVTIGALPPGLNLAAASGQLTGTPTTPGTYNFTVQVSDSLAVTTTKAFSLTINPALSITTATPLPAGTVGTAYPLLTFAAAGGTPAYNNWIVTVGALPPGLNLAAGTGQLTGTPTTPGTYNFTVQVTDSVATNATKAFSLTVASSLVITTATPLPAGTVTVPYPLLTFAAAGGTPAYNNWIVTIGALPPGLNLAAGTGALTGTPTTPGVYNFTVQVSDSVATTATKAFSLTVVSSLTITTATPLPGGTVSVVYPLLTFAAAGGTAPYNNWIVTVGSLPPGLNLAAGTGNLTGTPTTPGVYNFTVQVTDSVAGTATKAFSLTVVGPVTITTASPLPGGTVSVAYPLLTFAAAGGTAPYNNWIVTVGSLPPGLALAAATGALTGTPTTPGTYNFTVQVSDSVAATATKAFTLDVTAGLAITTATPLTAGAVSVAYPPLTFAAAGGTPPYNSWIVTVGSLPPGLNLVAATGVLSGTPTTAGVYNFTVQVSDSAGVPLTATKAFSLTVAATSCFSGPSATGAGTVQACVTGGGATCAFAAGTAQFIPLVGGAGSPPAGTAPAGILFPFGLFTFQLTGCTAGSTVAMTVTFPAAIPAGSVYYKYGPQPAQPTPSWYILPATLAGNTATFSITDGGLGDDDLVANGIIVDQGGPGAPGGGPGAGPIQTPTLSEWALMLLATLILLVGVGRVRRR